MRFRSFARGIGASVSVFFWIEQRIDVICLVHGDKEAPTPPRARGQRTSDQGTSALRCLFGRSAEASAAPIVHHAGWWLEEPRCLRCPSQPCDSVQRSRTRKIQAGAYVHRRLMALRLAGMPGTAPGSMKSNPRCRRGQRVQASQSVYVIQRSCEVGSKRFSPGRTRFPEEPSAPHCGSAPLFRSHRRPNWRVELMRGNYPRRTRPTALWQSLSS